VRLGERDGSTIAREHACLFEDQAVTRTAKSVQGSRGTPNEAERKAEASLTSTNQVSSAMTAKTAVAHRGTRPRAPELVSMYASANDPGAHRG